MSTPTRYMSRFYPYVFNGDGTTWIDLYRWYVILTNGEQVGTVWLEKEHIHDKVVT